MHINLFTTYYTVIIPQQRRYKNGTSTFQKYSKVPPTQQGGRGDTGPVSPVDSSRNKEVVNREDFIGISYLGKRYDTFPTYHGVPLKKDSQGGRVEVSFLLGLRCSFSPPLRSSGLLGGGLLDAFRGIGCCCGGCGDPTFLHDCHSHSHTHIETNSIMNM